MFCVAAAFTTYFCMYGFRKPFTAGTFTGQEFQGIAFKPLLIASQVLGYTISKFIGVKVVSEIRGDRRPALIIILILLAHLALLLFAITPAPWNLFMLFCNGLPLGMVFGLVVTYLEGRRLSEALVAGLCASFIVSSGVVKSVGRYLIQMGVPEPWMPFFAGLIFLPPILVAVWLLSHIPGPDATDVALRTKRQAMNRQQRHSFFRRHWFGLISLLTMYLLLTVVRSIRDDFGVEIWQQLGYDDEPSVFARSELVIAFFVVFINGAAISIRNSRLAFLANLVLMAVSFAIVAASVIGQSQGLLSAFPFMVLLGLGMYIPYVAFHTTVFERLIASYREPATIGYLMYLADAIGYLAYVMIVIFDLRRKKLEAQAGDGPEVDFLGLLNQVSVVTAVACIFIILVLFMHYLRTLPVHEDSSVIVAQGEPDV